MKPTLVKILAIDVLPDHWALWCSIEDGAPFENPIVMRRWSADGTKIQFMLDSHNFLIAAPDEELELVPYQPKYSSKDPESKEAFLAKRPNGIRTVLEVTQAKLKVALATLRDYADSDLWGPEAGQRARQALKEIEEVK